MTALVRIILHWTAGGPVASDLDKAHYHFIYEQTDQVMAGDLPPEENITTNDHIYGAHTRRLNTGSIGVAFAGMAQAQQVPFRPGPCPLLAPQIEAGCRHVAQLCRRYAIAVTRRTVLTHAEVQPTLGIAQRGKWDIRWLPGMTAVGEAVAVGDMLRSRIAAELKGLPR
jgi:hypothetical protein